jgi:hypothetical protein
MTGPNDYKVPIHPAAVYPVDIDGDGTVEFRFYSYGWYAGGTGYSNLWIESYNPIKYQVAAGNADTCFDSARVVYSRSMAASLLPGDTVSGTLHWLSESKASLTYSDWFMYGYNCSGLWAPVQPGGNFIAVRKIEAEDTIYGWIRVTNVHFLTFTVQEFAIRKRISGLVGKKNGIRIGPVPSKGIISLETPFKSFDVRLLDLTGKELQTLERLSGNACIDLQGLAPGVYILHIRSRQEMITRKIVIAGTGSPGP